MEFTDVQRITLSISDQSQLRSLADYVGLTSGITVERAGGQASSGEQGSPDYLIIAASSTTLMAAIRILPEFLRSRRSDVSVSMTIRDTPLTLTASNLDEVAPILERLLDA